MKLINRFYIFIKVKNGFLKDYVEKPYILKPGDKLFMLNYEFRGLDWRHSTILDTTEESITIQTGTEDNTFTLQFSQEPDYEKILGRRIKPEKRELEITPFPAFIREFKKSAFDKTIKPSTDLFDKDFTFNPWNLEEYLRNFKNVQRQQVTFL